MKFAYQFSNLLGTIYQKGNVLFTPDGNSVISPVGNKITIYDLKNNKAKTLSFESRYNYTALDISPNGLLMVVVNERGEAYMISMVSYSVIRSYKFSTAASCIKFSPDGKYFAITKENMVFIFKTPGEISGEYNHFVLRRYFFSAHDDIVCINWSSDSKILAIGAKDNSTKIYSVDIYENFRPYLLGGHTDSIVGCYFEENSLDINTISRNGQLCIWECSIKLEMLIAQKSPHQLQPVYKKQKVNEDEDDIDTTLETYSIELHRQCQNDNNIDQIEYLNKNDEFPHSITEAGHPFYYNRIARYYLLDDIKRKNRNAVLTATAYHKKSKLLITAYSTGEFYLHELPDVIMIHSLLISEYAIETACFNVTGDWIALAITGLGQLLVWEWQSEQYVMKQQNHVNEITSIAYSSDGQYIATGGKDSKVKLWNVDNGFCFVTFHQHENFVTAVEFSKNKNFLISASLDGTVRAYDIIRYRNFRTFTSPRPVQFTSVAMDSSSELIAAGAQDEFNIFLWSMKLGRLLEVLSGHEGPVVSLSFAPITASTTLVSGSWDKSIKIWNCLESSSEHETIDIFSDVTAIAFRSNGEEVAVAALNGNIEIFNVKNANSVLSIDGKNDLGSAISEVDLITAKKNLQGKYFTTIAFSADGQTLLAAGKSKNICIYHVKDGILLKKFEMTQNHSLDSLNGYINRRQLTDFGNIALIEQRDALQGGDLLLRLPGVQKGDMTSRNLKPDIKANCIKFSPSAQSWAVATTEGVLLFALNKGIVFDPFNLKLEITPKSTRKSIKQKEFSSALIMALKLNESNLIKEIIEQIPYKEIELVVSSLPDEYAYRTLHFVGTHLTATSHIEFYLQWACSILSIHGMKDEVLTHKPLISLFQSLKRKYEMLHKICDFNKYTIKVLLEINGNISIL